MLRTSRQGSPWVPGLVVLLVGLEARGQTEPALPPPPPASPWPTPAPWPSQAPPARSWSGVAASPPMSDAERAPQPVYAPVELRSTQRCPDDAVGRVFAEGLTVIGTAVGIGLLTAFLVRSEHETGTQVLTALGGITAYLFVVPVAQHAVARNFGGNGAWWASLLGGLLVPVLGHVIGYELSHEPLCNKDARARLGPHPRLAPYAYEAPRGALVAPALAPLPGGAVGMTVAF